MQSMALGSLGSGIGKGSRSSILFPVKESTHTQVFGAGRKHCRGQNLEPPSDGMQHTLGSTSRCSSQLSPNKSGIESAMRDRKVYK